MESTNKVHFDSLIEKISSGKERLGLMKKLLHDKQESDRKLAEGIRSDKDKLSEREKINDILICAKSLHLELNTRYSIMLSKCSIDFDSLSDFEILDLKKKRSVCMSR